MSGNIRLYNTNGYVELQAPSSASAQTLVLPTDSIQPGLVHLHTETFSAVSSVSVDNVFSSDYDNYQIVMQNVLPSSSSGNCIFRLRSSGTDTSANYVQSRLEVAGTSVAGIANPSTSNWSPTFFTATIYDFVITVFEPGKVRKTSYIYHNMRENGINYVTGSGLQTDTTAFDGFTFAPASGTFSGTIRIYGYRNA